jgi:hypothetical protein
MKLRTFNNQHGITFGPILFIIAAVGTSLSFLARMARMMRPASYRKMAEPT